MTTQYIEHNELAIPSNDTNEMDNKEIKEKNYDDSEQHYKNWKIFSYILSISMFFVSLMAFVNIRVGLDNISQLQYESLARDYIFEISLTSLNFSVCGIGLVVSIILCYITMFRSSNGSSLSKRKNLFRFSILLLWLNFANSPRHSKILPLIVLFILHVAFTFYLNVCYIESIQRTG
ncbi:hypothetical protein DFJ63DRAFT_101428 [Scheffersomyces coipomensis]|uniref:uncharacterized protein n=1 Tax=Scheffersomyces coipomensis TaxID=1788519 RepID=UPI00315D60D1